MKDSKLKMTKKSKFFRLEILDFILSRKANGFTLLEVLIVIGILAVLTSISAPIYRNFVKTSELGVTAKIMTSFLREARSKSMTGNLNLKWGIHFVNSGTDYYESFSTPTDYSDSLKSVIATTSLPFGVNFTAPVSTSDVIFGKIVGTTTATTTVTFTSTDGESKTVTVTPIGNIY